MFFMEIKNTLIAVAISLLLGGAVGWHYTDLHWEKKTLQTQVESMKAARADDLRAIKEAAQKDSELHVQLSQLQDQFNNYRTDIQRHVPTRPVYAPANPASAPGQASTNVMQPLVFRDDLLTSGAVCLLDAARSGLSSPDPACPGDGVGDSASTVTAANLIDNDLTIVGRYWALHSKYTQLRQTLIDFQAKQQGTR